MEEIEVKKKHLKLMLEGKYIPKDISIKEAKKRLKETDPGIDISEFIRILNSNDKDKILKDLLIEMITNPDILIYYMPVIKLILKNIIKV